MAEMRATVQIHVTHDLPIRAQALPYADRIEVRLGKEFPVLMLVDAVAFPHFLDALTQAHNKLLKSATNPQD